MSFNDQTFEIAAEDSGSHVQHRDVFESESKLDSFISTRLLQWSDPKKLDQILGFVLQAWFGTLTPRTSSNPAWTHELWHHWIRLHRTTACQRTEVDLRNASGSNCGECGLAHGWVNAKAYLDYRDLLCDSSIEAVTICLPHFLHEQVTKDALNAGKHVLVEKPLAISVEAGERLCRLAERVSRVLMVEMTHRFMPPVAEAREIVQAGRLGKILAVTETLFENIGLFGSLPTWMLSKEKAGGGVGLTSGIHLLDHVAWITGRPLSLQGARFGYSQALGDIEDTAAFFLTSDDGIPVHLTLGWRSEGKSLEGGILCHGTHGTLQVDCWGGWKIETGNGCQQRCCFDDGTSIAERALVGITSAIKEFVAAIRESRSPNPSADESLVSQQLIEQAYFLAKSQ